MASMKRKHLCYDDKRFVSATVEERLQNLVQLGALLEGMENVLIPVSPMCLSSTATDNKCFVRKKKVPFDPESVRKCYENCEHRVQFMMYSLKVVAWE
ncbi:hypothetical protein Gogos_011661, partial [Gossypium gossypioides]|nr:hypothetical protein [Gossypium gossypioides]